LYVYYVEKPCRYGELHQRFKCNSTSSQGNVTDFLYECGGTCLPDGTPPSCQNPINCGFVYRSFADCADNCNNPDSQQVAEFMLYGIDGFFGFGELLDLKINPVAACDIVLDTVNGVRDVLCVTLV
jgi:hypothetical protein